MYARADGFKEIRSICYSYICLPVIRDATEPTSEDVEYQTLTLTRGFDRTTAVKARGSKSTRREPERCRHVHQPQLQRSLYSARILAGHYVRSLRLQL